MQRMQKEIAGLRVKLHKAEAKNEVKFTTIFNKFLLINYFRRKFKHEFASKFSNERSLLFTQDFQLLKKKIGVALGFVLVHS